MADLLIFLGCFATVMLTVFAARQLSQDGKGGAALAGIAAAILWLVVTNS